MSSPIGHAIVALALARRLGVRSPRGRAAALAVALLPDADIALGLALHGDPWRLHRRLTHTPAFALGAGAVAGAAGLMSDGKPERGRTSAVLAGAAIGGSHLVLDNLPYVRLSIRPWVPAPLRRRVFGMSIANWLLDAAQCCLIARAIQRRDRP